MRIHVEGYAGGAQGCVCGKCRLSETFRSMADEERNVFAVFGGGGFGVRLRKGGGGEHLAPEAVGQPRAVHGVGGVVESFITEEGDQRVDAFGAHEGAVGADAYHGIGFESFRRQCIACQHVVFRPSEGLNAKAASQRLQRVAGGVGAGAQHDPRKGAGAQGAAQRHLQHAHAVPYGHERFAGKARRTHPRLNEGHDAHRLPPTPEAGHAAPARRGRSRPNRTRWAGTGGVRPPMPYRAGSSPCLR